MKDNVLFIGKTDSNITAVETISSGSLGVDRASRINGWPRSRIVEIYGLESSGKTTLALHAVAECQKQGDMAAFIDVEHSLDLAYAENLGVNTEELTISQPETGEQALEIVDTLTKSGLFGLIVIDSVAALVPKDELENPMDKLSVGKQAALMSKACRKLTGVVNKTNTCLMFINQVRYKIGCVAPETTVQWYFNT